MAGAADRLASDLAAADTASESEFRALLDEYGTLVYRVAYSLVREAPMAEDITQETMLKVWQGLPGFRSDAPIKHWIVRIAHNTAVSALRRRRDEAHDPQEWVIADRESPADVGRSVEDRAIREAFEKAIGQLDQTSRTIVLLREIEGLGYEEISEVLELPLPTVKTRLFRARRVLATELEGWRR